VTRIHFIWRDRLSWRHLPTAVSLHGHTNFSRENLDFIPAYLRSLPLLGPITRTIEAHRRSNDSGEIWWTPPLPPREAFRIEREQMERGLGRRALISMTDHDQIAACRTIHLLHGADAGPISLEWTVPLGPSFVHLGVHNLPPYRADAIFDELRAFTVNPRARRLSELLAWLSEDPATLVVLNHPLWDEAHIGRALHERMVRDLLRGNPGRIHAIELNGLRPWKENAGGLELSREMGIPAVSGGDRHGPEPSACLNLTAADTFSAFASEIRESRRSVVLFLSRYADCPRVRQLEATWDLIRDYPEYPDRVRWTDRTFIQDRWGVSRSLSSIWGKDEPLAARIGYQALRLFSHERLRPALRLAIARGRQEPAL
jgi:hypothetical protein